MKFAFRFSGTFQIGDNTADPDALPAFDDMIQSPFSTEPTRGSAPIRRLPFYPAPPKQKALSPSSPNTSSIFVRNIIVTQGQDVLCRFIEAQAWLKERDHNLLHSGTGKQTIRKGWGGEKVHSLEDWKKLGLDTHSIVAAPQFLDPAKGDFRVKTPARP